jgi:hypothetical protein
MLYAIESKPLDGRFDMFTEPLIVEGEFAPICDEFGIVMWEGGRFPSGHIETYAPNKGEWYRESRPLGKADATAYLAERLSRGSIDFEYRAVEAKSGVLAQLSC